MKPYTPSFQPYLTRLDIQHVSIGVNLGNTTTVTIEGVCSAAKGARRRGGYHLIVDDSDKLVELAARGLACITKDTEWLSEDVRKHHHTAAKRMLAAIGIPL